MPAAKGNLGGALIGAGKFAEAVAVLARVLVVMNRADGEDDANTLIAADIATHRQQGRLPEAEALLVWVLESSQRLHGEEHPVTLT